MQHLYSFSFHLAGRCPDVEIMSVEELPQYEQTLAETEAALKLDPTNEELLTIRATLSELVVYLRVAAAAAGHTSSSAASAAANEASVPTASAPSSTTSTSTPAQPTSATGPSVTAPSVSSSLASSASVPTFSAAYAPFAEEGKLKWEVGMRVIARWPEDDKLYLARIEAIAGDDYEVLYLQYGNRAAVQASDLHKFTAPSPDDLLPGQVIYALHPGDGMFYEGMVEGTGSGGYGTYKVRFKENKHRQENKYYDIYIPEEFKGRRLQINTGPQFAIDDPLTAKFVLPDRLKRLDSDTDAQKKLKQMRAKSLKKQFQAAVEEAIETKKQQSWQSFQAKLKPTKLPGSGGPPKR